MKFDAVSAIAAAVLYEGYILYPYSPNTVKNRQRWTFGGIFPRDYADAGGGDPCSLQVQCLLRGGPDTRIEIRPRFLRIVARTVGALPADGSDALTPVPVLDVDGTRHLAWDEAVEHEVVPPAWKLAQLLAGTLEMAFSIPATSSREPIRTRDGRTAGALLRDAADLSGRLSGVAEPIADDTFRLTVRIENLTPLTPPETTSRALAQYRSFASMHVLMGVTEGAFVSLIDPPAALAEASSSCGNQGVWPVLVGEAGAHDMMLAAPIILYDYPQVAPESPGDLFDATEIDEILSLRIVAMTDAEKRDMAAADARGRALLERTEGLGAADFARMHGVMRGDALTRRASVAPAKAGAAEGHARESFRVGDQVRLKPRRRADIMDTVLHGKIAVIEAIERDFEDRVHLAVTILDDPGREFGLERMPGHRFFFAPDEVEKLGALP